MARNKREVEEGDVVDEVVETPKEGTRTFTYIGHGEDPPRKINFMGKQQFVRGVPTEVSDMEVLAKLEGHRCFVEGEVDQEMLHDQDEAAIKAADRQRAEDRRTHDAFKKQQRALAPKGEED